VRFLYTLGNEQRTIRFGLERIRAILDELGRPQDAFQSVHVAGTNGKGSTCAMIESGLRLAGRRTGLFISPHLVDPVERIQAGGVPVTHDEFAAAFDEVHAACERLLAQGRIDMHATYFETITAMGFLLFRRRAVEVAVLEAGMGGRLDATNVVDPVLSVITPVDFDHEKYLGDTIPKIAAEKAGIIKPGRPAVFARQHREAEEVLEAAARAVDAPFVRAADWSIRGLHFGPYESRFCAVGPGAFINVDCRLIGAHQIENALTAAVALSRLGLVPEEIRRGIAAARWPGRLEIVAHRPEILLDGAHNPAGARALAVYVERFLRRRRIWMIFAAMQDKDLAQLGRFLFPLASELIFTAPPGQPRAWPPETMREITGQSRARCAATPREALALARAGAGPDDVILVTGSLYLVGAIRGELLP
jgi:dihydrofolate synthase/folylpolyglutamate synthase